MRALSRQPQAFSYLRASHRDSVESGAGLAAQERQVCEMFDAAQVDGLKWSPHKFDHDSGGRFCDKAVSAFSVPFFSRPAAKELMKHLRKGDHLFVAKTDRMFRSVKNMGITLTELSRLKVNLHYGDIPLGTDTPMGAMMLSILVTFAEWESRMKSFRIKEAFAIRKAARDGTLVMTPEQAKRLVRSPTESEKRTYEFKRGASDPRIFDTIPRAVEEKPADNQPGRILIYIRCSHQDSVDSGLGLEAQLAACRRFAARLQEQNPNLPVVLEFSDEAVSAYMHRFKLRPNGKKLTEQLQPGDHVLFARLDRAFRSVRDCAETIPEWQERGIHIHFVNDGLDTTTPIGRAMVSIMSAFAQIEPEMTSTRTREALRELRTLGRGVNSCFGFKWERAGDEKSLVPDKARIKQIRLSVLINRRRLSLAATMRRVEELYAKHEGRRPLPEAGISLYCAKKWIGDRDPTPYIPSTKDGKACKHPLLKPLWCRQLIKMALERWPLIQAYLALKCMESKARRVTSFRSA